MSATTGFWKRVGNLFRHDYLTPGARRETTAVILDDPPAASPHNGHAGAHDQRPLAARRLFWTRSRFTHERVLELMDAMQEHFRRQDLRAEALAASVDRVGEIIERLAESQRAQGESIAVIAAQVTSAGQQTARLAYTLSEVPTSLAAQAQVVRSIAQSLDAARETETQMVQSLQRFGLAVDSLRETGSAQVEALQRMHTSDLEQTDALKGFIREQNRRHLVAMLVVGLLGVGGLAAAMLIASRALS